MSQPNDFETVISTLATCLDDVDAMRRTSPTWDRRLFDHHTRLQKLYLDVCTLAAEHGNAQGQRILHAIGQQLASMAKPHHVPAHVERCNRCGRDAEELAKLGHAVTCQLGRRA